MATDLYLISNISTTTATALAQKEFYLEELKKLNFWHLVDYREGKYIDREGEWEYELPNQYDESEDLEQFPEMIDKELISFSGPFVFNIRVYENCLELTTIYKYRYLYEDAYRVPGVEDENFLEFRKNVLAIISIFGGTEIIYLADNGCDKLGKYLELMAWEGVSYTEIKQKMLLDNIPFVNDYNTLKLENLRYSKITEYVFDDFKDIISL
jgi:hypothetical protein